MIDIGIIERIDTAAPFEATSNCVIRFYEDWDDIADNLLHPWKGEVGNALEHSANLVNLIMEAYIAAWEENEEGNEICPDKAFSHPSYKSFLHNVSVLDKVDVLALSTEEKVCFFLNVY